MGTALTAQTVASTYDSLLKVTDNGPVGGSLKTVTDGLGNDSALQLSTAGVKSLGTLEVAGATTLSTTLAVTGAATLSSTLAVTGATTIGGNTAVTGTLSATTQVVAPLFGTTTAANVTFQRNGVSVGVLSAQGLAITHASNPFFSLTGANGPHYLEVVGNDVRATVAGDNDFIIRTNSVNRVVIDSTGLAVTGTGSFSGLVSVGGSTPASASASGTAGTVTWDSSYIYVCTATNTWKRAAIATW